MSDTKSCKNCVASRNPNEFRPVIVCPEHTSKSQSNLIDQVIEWCNSKRLPYPENKTFDFVSYDVSYENGCNHFIDKLVDYLQKLKENHV